MKKSELKRKFFSPKEIIIVLLAMLFCLTSAILLFTHSSKQVIITCEGKKIFVKTLKSTVKDVLAQQNIKIAKYDYVSPSLDTRLKTIKQNTIYIRKAIPLKITVDGKTSTIMTCKNTVNEALKSANLSISSSDKILGAKPEERIVAGMELSIIRVEERTLSEKTSIPFKVVSKENSHLEKGVKRVIKEGKEGLLEKSFKVILEDGKVVTKQLLKEVTLSNPVDALIELGTLANYKTSRGNNIRYKKVLNMSATAYTASYEDTGKSPGHPQFGITYTGVRAKRGIIAVDPRVIPLGTKVYIEGVGNVPDYGYAVAADIGGAIKGNLIDLYYDDISTVRRWGKKSVKVYILEN